MIPKVAGRGHSFKGLALYLLNDTDEMQPDDPSRVDWTETGNLLTDDIEKAARVMAWTDSHADDLKASAGISNAGARPSAGAVYHYTLAWAVGEQPTPDHMKDAAKETLAALGLSEHEFFVVAHRDRPHRHVHVVVNLTHPEKGTRAELGRDFVTLQKWALAYERQHGLHCEVREENAAKREQGEKVKYRGQKQDYATAVTRAFHLSDDGKSFAAALENEGLYLAKSRRGTGFVIVDEQGEVQKLGRQLDIAEKDRAKTAAINKKLADFDRDLLPDADELAAEIKARAQAAADLEAQSYRDDQEAAQQSAMLDAADEAAAQTVEAEQEQERARAFQLKQEIDRAEARHAALMLETEARHAKEQQAHEREISAFYSPKIEEATKAADELQAKVDGTGFRLALRRIWRGRKDREELAHLRHEITAYREKVAEQRKAFAAIHQREKDELSHLHSQRMHHLRQTFTTSREQEQDSHYQESPRLLGTGRRVALETAQKRRAKAIQKRAYEMREAEEARQAQLAREREMLRQRPEFEQRQEEIRQGKPDAVEREITRLRQNREAGKDRGRDHDL